MPTNPSLTFAEAVAVIKADDTQLVRNLKNAESKVTASVGKMQGSFDNMALSAGTGAAAISQAAALSGNAVANVAGQVAGLAAGLSAQLSGIVALLGGPVIVGIVAVGAAIAIAFNTKRIADWLAGVKDISEVVERLDAKLIASQQSTEKIAAAFRFQREVLLGISSERDKLVGLARQEFDELQRVKAVIERRALLEKRRVADLEKSAALQKQERMDVELAAKAEQARTAAKRASLLTGGPGDRSEVGQFIRLQRQAFDQQQRTLFLVRTGVEQALSAGRLSADAANFILNRFGGASGAQAVAQARAPGITRLRRVEAFAGAGDTAGLDKTRNQLIKDTNTALADLTAVVRDAGGIS